MKETELWVRMDTHLGRGYSRVWAAEHNLAALGGRTVDQAIADGPVAVSVSKQDRIQNLAERRSWDCWSLVALSSMAAQPEAWFAHGGAFGRMRAPFLPMVSPDGSGRTHSLPFEDCPIRKVALTEHHECESGPPPGFLGHQNGQNSGINATATNHKTRFSGAPTRIKSLNR